MDFTDECFPHGQLYAGMSRSKDPSTLFVIADDQQLKILFYSVEIVLLIVLKLCYVILGHSEVGEKLQQAACRGEVVDRNFVIDCSQIP